MLNEPNPPLGAKPSPLPATFLLENWAAASEITKSSADAPSDVADAPWKTMASSPVVGPPPPRLLGLTVVVDWIRMPPSEL